MGTEFNPVIFMVLCDDEPKTEGETIEQDVLLDDADAEFLLSFLQD